MKQIVLKRIRLSDWKAKNLDVTFNDEATKISARNEVGKSSLQQAWNWVLTGYTTPITTKNSDLFDNRVELSPDTPEAVVKVWISVDGVDYTIERSAKAKFKRPRGQAEYVKDTSDTYIVKVDDIEMSATNFAAWVTDVIAPIEVLLYALDGAFFSTLTVNDRDKARAILERMVGSITLDDYCGDYELIADRLIKYTPEQIREQAASQMRPVKKRFDEIPAIIESKKEFIHSYSSKDWAGLEETLASTKKAIEDIDSEMTGISQKSAPIIARIAEASDARQKIKDAMVAEREAIIAELRKKLVAIDESNSRKMRDNAHKECERISCETIIRNLTEEIARLEADKANLLDEVMAEVCPTCGQQMPQDVINDNIRKRVAYIDAKIELHQFEISKCKEKLSSGNLRPCDLISTTDLEASLASYMGPIDFCENEEYNALTEEINKLNVQVKELSDSSSISDLKLRKGDLIGRVETISKELGIRDKLDVVASEINALRDERKALACEMAHLEGVQAKCQEYIEERANIISNRINSRLGGCQVRMFNIQKNGERTPDCVLTDKDGVNYATLSTSAKIRVNIDVQELFRSHYGVQLMTWVDECSIFDSQHLPKPDGQCCYLFAGDSPTLVVE
jgi:hypothetical protein